MKEFADGVKMESMIPSYHRVLSLLSVLWLIASVGLAGPEEATLWFSSLGGVPGPSGEESRGVAQAAAFRLGWVEAEPTTEWNFGRRGVLATLVSSEGSAYEVILGVGQGWSGALEDLGRKISLEQISRQRMVIIELIKEVHSHRLESPSLFRTTAELRGIAFHHPSQGFLSPGEVLGRAALEPGSQQDGLRLNRQRTDQLISERVLQKDPRFSADPWKGPSPIFSFRTDAFRITPGEVVPLRRYRQLWAQPPQAVEARAAARAAADYLVRATDPQGRFIYQYQADRDEESTRYNLVRHAGTAWSVLRLGIQLNDPKLGRAGLRQVSFLEKKTQVVFWDGKPYRALVNHDQALKLGGQALAILALLEAHSWDVQAGYRKTAEELGEWILATQGESGDQLVHKYWVSKDQMDDFRSTYYPGEALLALEKLSQATGEDRWSRAADRLAQWIITERDGALNANRLPHDHWFLYGAGEILRRRDWPELRAHGTAIVQQILRSQFKRTPTRRPEWEGGFTSTPTVGRASIRLEGLLAMLPHLADFGLELEVRMAAERGAAFLMRSRMNREISVFFAESERVEGAFPRAFGDYSLRIDSSQHALSALQMYADLVK